VAAALERRWLGNNRGGAGATKGGAGSTKVGRDQVRGGRIWRRKARGGGVTGRGRGVGGGEATSPSVEAWRRCRSRCMRSADGGHGWWLKSPAPNGGRVVRALAGWGIEVESDDGGADSSGAILRGRCGIVRRSHHLEMAE